MQNFTETDLRKSTYKLKTYIHLMEEEEQSARGKAWADRPSEVKKKIDDVQAKIDKYEANLEKLRNPPPEPEDTGPRSTWQRMKDYAKGLYSDVAEPKEKDLTTWIENLKKEKEVLQKQYDNMPKKVQAPAGQTQPPAGQTQPPAGQTQPPAGNNSWDPTALGNQYADAGFAPAGNNSWDPTALGNQYADAGFAPKSTSSTQTPATASTSATRQTGAAKPKSKKPAKQSAKSDPFIVATQQDLNKRLAQIGKPPIKVDGINGPQTRAALRTVMDYEHVNRRQRAAQPAPTPAAQPAPNATSNPFVFSESTKYNEDPILTRIIRLAGL